MSLLPSRSLPVCVPVCFLCSPRSLPRPVPLRLLVALPHGPCGRLTGTTGRDAAARRRGEERGEERGGGGRHAAGKGQLRSSRCPPTCLFPVAATTGALTAGHRDRPTDRGQTGGWNGEHNDDAFPNSVRSVSAVSLCSLRRRAEEETNGLQPALCNGPSRCQCW